MKGSHPVWPVSAGRVRLPDIFFYMNMTEVKGPQGVPFFIQGYKGGQSEKNSFGCVPIN